MVSRRNPASRRRSASRYAAALLTGCLGALACAMSVSAAAAPVALGSPGGTRIDLVECRTGHTLGAIDVPATLSSLPVVDLTRGAVYAATEAGDLQRHPLEPQGSSVSGRLGFVARALALAPGEDGFVLAGGSGIDALSARDSASLAELHRFRHEAPATVAAIVAVEGRQRFVVGFSDHPLLWEIAWDRAAPPVLLGFVHDYRNGEAVPLPGRMTPRPFKLPSATLALVPGASDFELVRVDGQKRLGLVNLDVRREIERLPVDRASAAGWVAPWRVGARRGWLIARPGTATLDVLEATGWQVKSLGEADGEVLALAPAGQGVLIAHRAGQTLAVSRADPGRGTIAALRTGIADARPPLRFLSDGAGCTALIDAGDRWIAGFEAAARER